MLAVFAHAGLPIKTTILGGALHVTLALLPVAEKAAANPHVKEKRGHGA